MLLSHYLKMDLNLKFCRGCRRHHLWLKIFKLNEKNDWGEIHDLTIKTITHHELSFYTPQKKLDT